ncbi:Pentatricopeptide repeat (PPR) superfamily protein [Euphorbia peplus]|nr:Pentatricopeptide repeat (PPR) superfamily protein [Euphorbia peplus]
MKLHLLLRQISQPKPSRIQHFCTSYSEETTICTSYSEETAISNEILSVIETVNPMEPALELMVPFLIPETVKSIIENPPNPSLGFRFFIWASKYRKFRLWDSRAIVVDCLTRENCHELYLQVLKEIKECNFPIPASAFTLLIQAYAKMGMNEKALETFEMMKVFGSEANVHTYNAVLHLLTRTGFLVLGLGLYNRMLKLNCSPNRTTFSILIDGMCKGGNIEDALGLFDEMVRRGIFANGITYTIVISGLCKADKTDVAYSLFNTMKDDGFTPDVATYGALLDGFCKAGRVDEALRLLKRFEEDGYVLNKLGYSCLIDGLFSVKRNEDAKVWYKKMIDNNIKPDVVLYTIMIKGLSKAGEFKSALELSSEMIEMGVVPDTQCYNALIKASCDMGLLDNAKSLLLEISEHNCFPDSHTYTILISEMCKNGLVGEAERIFSEMNKVGCKPSRVTFNALLDGLCKAHQLKKAQLLFYKMEVGRDTSLFLRLSQGGNQVVTASSVHKMVEELCLSGLILKAYSILTQLVDSAGVSPDISTYNILINGFCREGDINVALKLFEALQRKGLSPNSVTYGTLINGLFKARRDKDAFRFFDQIMENHFVPDLNVYRTLMTWSCRLRKVNVAFILWLKYLQSIPGRDNEVLTTLGEYFEKGEVEKAIRGLLEMDFKMNDFQLEPYTIFLNGLCQAGRIEAASKLFSILQELKVIITPPSCVKLIYGLLEHGSLDLAAEIFVYTIEKGHILKHGVINQLLWSLIRSEDRRNLAFDLLTKMETVGYDLNSHLYRKTKLLLYGH